MEEILSKGKINIYTDQMIGEDGTERNFVIVGQGNKNMQMSRDKKGNLTYGSFQKIQFYNLDDLDDLIEALALTRKKVVEK